MSYLGPICIPVLLQLAPCVNTLPFIWPIATGFFRILHPRASILPFHCLKTHPPTAQTGRASKHHGITYTSTEVHEPLAQPGQAKLFWRVRTSRGVVCGGRFSLDLFGPPPTSEIR